MGKGRHNNVKPGDNFKTKTIQVTLWTGDRGFIDQAAFQLKRDDIKYEIRTHPRDPGLMAIFREIKVMATHSVSDRYKSEDEV